ncbi:MAG: SURF1 family protein [Endozoicomonas sp.]
MMGLRTKLTLLVIPLLALLISLGFWQLSRYGQKLDLEQGLEQRRSMPPLSYSDLRNYEDPLFLPLKVTGRFFQGRYFLHDNQIHKGRAGYDLIAPFVTSSGSWVLVNRGWVSATSRDELPDLEEINGEVQLSGTIYRLLGKPFMLGEDTWMEGWPKRIQTLDFERMGKALGQKIPSMLLILDEGQPGAQTMRPLLVKTGSQKHLGYAFQWFTMALVLLGMYGYQLSKQMNKHGKREDAGRG